MAVDSSLIVGATGESLETTKTGPGFHREGVYAADPYTDGARARVAKTVPDGTDYGLHAYVLGNVTVTSSVLPTGAATSARQDTGNTSLASIEARRHARRGAHRRPAGERPTRRSAARGSPAGRMSP
jgi:hypothetical protein